MKHFTSDLHFWHQNIIKYCSRPAATVEEMNELLITNWNTKVDPSDTVYILGDVFFCKPPAAMEILSRLNGWKKLVLGNHDKVIQKCPELLAMFDEALPDLHSESIDGITVNMSHYPLMSWKDRSKGSFMLHGHMHNTVPFDPTKRRMDVGVDAHNLCPISWDEIKEKLLAVPVNNY